MRRAPARATSPARVARAVAALAAAALVLWGALFSGQSYLFCLMMERPVAACCCLPDRSDAITAPAEHPVEIGNGCCETRGGGEIAAGHVAPPAPEVPPATPTALGAMLPVAPAVATFTPSRAGLAERSVRHPIRAGPGSPARATDACIRLQVFRC